MASQNPPVTIDDVVALLRNDRLRGYKIDVETDQMIETDENAEKQRRVELITAMGQMMNQASPVIMSPIGAALAPMIEQTMLFALRGFRVGRDVEETVESAFGALVEQLSQPQQPKEDPAAQAELQKALIEQKRVQIEEAKAAQEMRLAQERHDADLQSKARHDARSDAETELKIRTQRDEMSARLAEQKLRAHVGEDGEMTEAVTNDDFFKDQILGLVQQANASAQQAHAAVQQGHASNQLVADAIARLAAPKRLIRDETGRAIGVEHVPSRPQ